jgi:hypothetical protein
VFHEHDEPNDEEHDAEEQERDSSNRGPAMAGDYSGADQ